MPLIEIPGRVYRYVSDRDIDEIVPTPARFENFRKANGPLGPLNAWTAVIGTLAVVNNAAEVSAGTPGVARVPAVGVQECWASVSCLTPAIPCGPAIFMGGATLSGYVAYQDTDLRWTLGRYDAGVYSVMTTFLGGPAVEAGDLIKLVHISGGRLYLWHGDRLVLGWQITGTLLFTQAPAICGFVGARMGQLRGGVGDSQGPWRRGLARLPTVSRSTRDPHFGALEPDEVTFGLENDGSWTPDTVLALRGKPVTIEAWDALDTAAPGRTEAFTGVVANASLNPDVISIKCTSLNQADLQTHLPKGTIAVADFPLAVDIGATPAVPFGLAPRVPLRYLHRDISTNVYRYGCRRNATVVNLYRDWHDGLFFIPPAEYTVDYAVYPGYTTVVFPKQQIDISGGNHKIFADLSFADPAERNFIRVIRYFLNDPTWGLGRPYNAASFAAAEAALDAFGGLFCDGHAGEPRAASEYLRMLVLVRMIRLWVNVFGEYEISVDTGTDVVQAVLGAGLGDGPHNILEASGLEGSDMLNAVSKVILKYRRDVSAGEFTMETSRPALDFGQELTEENIFIDAHGTADRVVDHLAKLAVEADRRVRIVAGPGARSLQARDTILITHDALGLAGERMRVVSTQKGLDSAELIARRTSPRLYSYTAGTVPLDGPNHGFTDYSRVIPASVTGLSAVGGGTELGIDGTTVSYRVLQFVTPTGSTPAALSYYSARVDFKPQAQTIYHTGYATVIGTGTRQVKVAGLVAGITYDYQIVPLTQLGTPGVGTTLSGDLAPGDTSAPAAPSAPTLQAQHLREYTWAVTTGPELDIASLEWDVRTAATGGGSVVMTGTGPTGAAGATSTFKFTLPASVGYGVARHVRVRFKDHTGNPTSPTANWSPSTSFTSARNQSDDYENLSVLSQTIANRAVQAAQRAAMSSISGLYSLAHQTAFVGSYTHGLGQIPSVFLDVGDTNVTWNVLDITSSTVVYWILNNATSPVDDIVNETGIFYFR